MNCGCLFLVVVTLIGSSIGGPIGGIIAFFIALVIIGNISDNAENSRSNSSNSFIVLFFSILGRMAKADGRVQQIEADTVKVIINHLGLQGEDRKLAVNAFNSAIRKNIDIYRMAKDYTASNPDYNMRIILYRALWNVAAADSLISEEEVKILKNILHSLNLPNTLFDIYAAEFGYFRKTNNNSGYGSSYSDSDRNRKENRFRSRSSSLNADYEILGISPDADVDTIQKAYREKVREFHPDKIQSKGLPESFVKFAEEEMKKINEAYNNIKKAKGF
jgi:DnaJ like chaperone protein